MNVATRKTSELVPLATNARIHSEFQVKRIAESLKRFLWVIPILIDEGGTIIAGHGRILAAEHLGLTDIPCAISAGWTEEEKRAYAILDNTIYEDGDWDEDVKSVELSWLEDSGFETDAFFGDEVEEDDGLDENPSISLAERFGVAPFSVLNAREGWWQSRKRAWMALGIKSEAWIWATSCQKGKSLIFYFLARPMRILRFIPMILGTSALWTIPLFATLSLKSSEPRPSASTMTVLRFSSQGMRAEKMGIIMGSQRT